MKAKVLVFFLLVLVYSACTNDNEEDSYGKKECEDPVSFTNDIEPIIQSSCAIATCHTAGNQPPNLTSYQNIKNAASGVKSRTSNRTMPPPGSGVTLSTDQITKIACWVDSGAQNN